MLFRSLVERRQLQGDPREVPVVDVARAAPPFALACGEFKPDGFARRPDDARAAPALAGRTLRTEAHPVPGERDRVLVAMTVAEVTASLRPLSTCNESCEVFTAAFLALYALCFLALPFVWAASRRASPGR